jgi:hypothetical protein
MGLQGGATSIKLVKEDDIIGKSDGIKLNENTGYV